MIYFWQLSPFCKLCPCSVQVNVTCFKWKFTKKQPQCASYAHTQDQGRWFFLGVSICSVLNSGHPDLSSMGFLRTAGKGSLRMELFANCMFLSSFRNVTALFRQFITFVNKQWKFISEGSSVMFYASEVKECTSFKNLICRRSVLFLLDDFKIYRSIKSAFGHI